MQGSTPMRTTTARPSAAIRTRVLAIPALVVVAISVALLRGSISSEPWQTVLLVIAMGVPLAFAAMTSAQSSALAREVSALRSVQDTAQHEMASMAHDLKGPLSTVTSYLDLIADGALGPVSDDKRVAAQRAAQASVRARTLVESALLQHVEATASRPPDVATVDLRALIRDVTDALYAEIAASQAEVTVEPLPVVRGNATQLFRVFENLVQNAVKYARPGETPVITITGSMTDGHAEILVTDHGIGIPSEDCERVGGTSTRAANGTSVAQGHGLGLATVRRLVREQGGDAWIDRTACDGATVRLSLPLG